MLVTHVKSHVRAVSVLDSGEQHYTYRSNQQQQAFLDFKVIWFGYFIFLYLIHASPYVLSVNLYFHTEKLVAYKEEEKCIITLIASMSVPAVVSFTLSLVRPICVVPV